MNKLINFLIYITNNNKKSIHEPEWDIAFFLLTTIALIVGTIILYIRNCPEWIAFLFVEYIWCLDGIRHNRE